MARLSIRVIPKAGTDEVAGLRGDEVVVRVKAAPDAGKANASACRVVASLFGVAPSAVRVTRGHTSRHKLVDVLGVTDAEIAKTLELVERLE